MKRKLKQQDKQIKKWLKKGGRKGAKEDFMKVITQASKPLHSQPEQAKDQT